jgi:hypothetical protein
VILIVVCPVAQTRPIGSINRNSAFDILRVKGFDNVSGVTLDGAPGTPNHFDLWRSRRPAAGHWLIVRGATGPARWCSAVTIIMVSGARTACRCGTSGTLGSRLQGADGVMKHEAATLWHLQQHGETVERPDPANQSLAVDQVDLEHRALTAPLVQCRELDGSAGF